MKKKHVPYLSSLSLILYVNGRLTKIVNIPELFIPLNLKVSKSSLLPITPYTSQFRIICWCYRANVISLTTLATIYDKFLTIVSERIDSVIRGYGTISWLGENKSLQGWHYS